MTLANFNLKLTSYFSYPCEAKLQTEQKQSAVAIQLQWSYLHCISFVFPQFTSFHSVIHSSHGLMNSINWSVLSAWVFIAQLVEHCNANTNATGSNRIEAPKTPYFQAISQLLKSRFSRDGYIFISDASLQSGQVLYWGFTCGTVLYFKTVKCRNYHSWAKLQNAGTLFQGILFQLAG